MMKKLALFVSMGTLLTILGCSKNSQQTAAKDAPAVVQAATPAAPSVPTPAVQEKPTTVEYLGMGCGDNGEPAFAERVKFIFSGDTATMTIIESEPPPQGGKLPLTLVGSLQTDEEGPNWVFMKAFENQEFLNYVVRRSLKFNDVLLAIVWRDSSYPSGEVFTAAPHPDPTAVSAEFVKTETREFRRPLAWHLNADNDHTCVNFYWGFYNDGRSEK